MVHTAKPTTCGWLIVSLIVLILSACQSPALPEPISTQAANPASAFSTATPVPTSVLDEADILETAPEVQSVDLEEPFIVQEVIGASTDRHPVEAYRFGNGPIAVALIGGIHGGYEWNTVLLSYEMIDYFAGHPDEIPASISIYIIPAANPDGVVLVTGHTGRFDPTEVTEETFLGRFNANEVDINRNWDCKWEQIGYIFEIEVDAGSAPFSEAETRILRDFILEREIDAVVFWHSQMGTVFPGGHDGPHRPSQTLARHYAAASGYEYLDSFDEYPVSGDAADWLSVQGIAAIEVELAEHDEIEFEQNLSGVRAIMTTLTKAASGAAR